MSGGRDISQWMPPLELGRQVEDLINYAVVNGEAPLGAARSLVLFFVLNIEGFLQWLPWWGWLAGVFWAGSRLVDPKTGLTLSLMVFTVGWLGYWPMMVLTMAIVITSVSLALCLGIPAGIFIARHNWAEKILHPILDAMQTTPSFVYLLPAVMLFGLGKVPAVFATTIYALPPVIRLTNLGLRNVSATAVMVADSFGCTGWQKLLKVQLPQALPMITAGINQTTMMSLGMVITSAMIGAKGLGLEILTAIGRMQVGPAFEAGLCIVFMAITLDRLTQGLVRRFNRGPR